MKNNHLLAKITSVLLVCLFGLVLREELLAKPKSKDTETSEQIAQIQAELKSVEQKLNRTVSVLNNLSKKVNQAETPEPAPADYSSQISQLDSSLKILESVTASLDYNLVKLQRQVNQNAQRANYTDSINFEILSQLVILENRIVSLSSSLSESKTITESQATEKTVTTGGSYKDRYLQALTFHQNGNNNESISLFRQLLNEDQYNELADNAQYWIGECFYSMKQYRRAIVEFEKVFAFKNSNKEDDAQFKLGLCYAALGEREKAIDEFQRLIDYYPQSEFVNNAKQFVK